MNRKLSMILSVVAGAVLGGISAVCLVIVVPLIADQFQSDLPGKYVNPSAAVGEALAWLRRVASVFALGACAGVVLAILRNRRH